MALTTTAHEILRDHPMDAPGDLPPAFWTLLERYRSDLVNQAFAIVGNASDAEDVVQETFCEAHLKQEQLTGLDSVGAWLRKINKANALDRLRARRREAGRVERRNDLQPPRQATTGGFSMLELREFLAKAIDALPDEQRSVVVLRYWEHLTYDEIARRLNMPAITVRRRLYEAYLSLYQRPELRGAIGAPQADAPNAHAPEDGNA
ncbi:MAG: RNA polymerase sigma factor [Planctomycetota bacterium]|nr:RNA polymerase sigma factor [Planctomycetota bacterium]